MSKHDKTKLGAGIFFSVLAFIAGIALVVLRYAWSFFQTDDGAKWTGVCLWGGVALAGIGFIALLVCSAKRRRAQKRAEEENSALDEENAQSSEPEVTYIPNREAYELIDMGKYQTMDDKFAQIGQMDRTQFVIYMARLFSLKGYQVKLTPVIDNHDIDMLVEKLGVTIAVGCLISNRVLGQEDIVCVNVGKQYYDASDSMVITNMYFDRTALDYAKAERMSLVDRNILASEFMR